MAKLPVRLSAVIILTAVAALPALAAKKADAKKAGEIAIKALEQQIHEQRAQEKAALKALDAQYEHVIKSMDPKEVRGQLEEILVVLRQVREDLGYPDDLYFGGNRLHARESAENAEHQVERALHHNTAEERAKAVADFKGAIRLGPDLANNEDLKQRMNK